jgi:hypothetical protein
MDDITSGSWLAAQDLQNHRGHRLPDIDELPVSAICGVARVVEIVTRSRSKWLYRPDDGLRELKRQLPKMNIEA